VGIQILLKGGTMNVTKFGERYGVKITNPNQKSGSLEANIQLDADSVVEGKCGMIQNLLPNELATDGNRLVLSLMAVPRNADMNKKLSSRAKDAEAAGMILKSRSGYETQWYFNPADPRSAAAALKAVGARKRRTRILSEDQRQALAVRLASARASSLASDTLPA
jgi:hypothetical protein